MVDQHKPAGRPMTNADRREWVLRLLSEAEDRHFYGRLNIIFEDGVIQRAFREESLVPHSNR